MYNKMGSIILIAALIGAFIVGISTQFVTNRDDTQVEEITEEFIETQIERALDLKQNELDGKIDLSPSSREKNV